MIEQQFLSGFTNFGLGVFTLAAARDDGAALEGGGCAIEDEDGLGAEEQELANATEETKQMGVANHFTLVVAHRFHELHHPYTRICRNRIIIIIIGNRLLVE